jgi:hypothetical protein
MPIAAIAHAIENSLMFPGQIGLARDARGGGEPIDLLARTRQSSRPRERLGWR